MTYTLDMHFDPPVRRRRIHQYFNARKFFTVTENEIVYENSNTGVGFFLSLKSAGRLFSRWKTASAEFTINVFRPSYFGIEAEIELSAFMAAFAPRIEDPQMDGMGEGPYSGEGFLRGWNFSNLCAVHWPDSATPPRPIPSMAADKLRAAWTWNYRLEERREKVGDLQFVPSIGFIAVEGRPCCAAVWPLTMPSLLPRVDYVVVGLREVEGKKHFGLASWSEILEVVERGGLDPTTDPLHIAYLVTPGPIAKWFRQMPEIDMATIPWMRPDSIIDREILDTPLEMTVVDPSRPLEDQL